MTIFDALALYAIGALLIAGALAYFRWRITVLRRWLAREEPDEHERGST